MPFLSSTAGVFGYGRAPSSVPFQLVTSGLVIQLDAYNTLSYPGTGTTVNDITSGFTHTLTDGAVYVTLYGVKTFDCTTGTRQVVCNGTGPTLPTTGYTYVTWAKINTSSSTWRTLFRTLPNDHPLLVQISTDNLGFYDNDTGNFIDSGYDVTPILDVWVQYTVVGDSTSSIFYINGSQVGTVAFGAGGNRHSVWGGWQAGQPFGYVANMFYYNRKLTLYEITQNYTFLSPRFQNITTSGLILYYDPSNTLSYSGSGTSLLNLASADLNGTMTSVSFTTPYLNFNGTTSQVSVADNALLEPGTGDWTIEMWIRYSVIAGKTRTYLSKTNNGGGAADWGYGFRTNSVANTTYMEVGNGTTSINSPATPVTTGVWYQIVGVWTNIALNSIALYKNGDLVGSNSHSFTSIKNTTTPLYIGNYNGNEFAQQFEGNIGVVRIYNRALTAAEIQTNYNANKSLYGL